MRVYFDNAATTPIRQEVVEAMMPYLLERYGNPSSIHAEGRVVRTAVELARKSVAQHLKASIGEIFFTSCGTESNNMALKGAVRDLGVRRIITSPLEHHCVLHATEALAHFQAVEVIHLQVDATGAVNYEQLETLLSQEQAPKTLVSLMHANNEIGTLLDLERVAALCSQHQALFHTDTVQTIGHYPLNLRETPISFLSGSAHKFHGPKGIGFIYINSNNIIKPYIDGGAQERNMRAGTENVVGIVGLAKALDLAYEHLEADVAAISELKYYMKGKIAELFPEARFNSDAAKEGLYTVLSVSFPPSAKGDMLLMSLDLAGVSVSGGSACSSGSDAGSHVINGIRPNDSWNTVRFSFSRFNTREEVDYALAQLQDVLGVSATIAG